MTDICRKYGFEITRGGYILCPFHHEKTASLKLYPKGFHCFGCGAGGSVIDFAMRYFGLDFRAAAGRLNYDFGLGLPAGRSMTYREKSGARRRSGVRSSSRRRSARPKNGSSGNTTAFSPHGRCSTRAVPA